MTGEMENEETIYEEQMKGNKWGDNIGGTWLIIFSMI